MTWVRFLGYAAFSALGWVYQVVILDEILSWCDDHELEIQEFRICLRYSRCQAVPYVGVLDDRNYTAMRTHM
jgi:hypothetical protein